MTTCDLCSKESNELTGLLTRKYCPDCHYAVEDYLLENISIRSNVVIFESIRLDDNDILEDDWEIDWDTQEYKVYVDTETDDEFDIIKELLDHIEDTLKTDPFSTLNRVDISADLKRRMAWSPSTKLVRIGCQTFPLAFWLENYEAIGKDYKLTDDEIEAYHKEFLKLSET